MRRIIGLVVIIMLIGASAVMAQWGNGIMSGGRQAVSVPVPVARPISVTPTSMTVSDTLGSGQTIVGFTVTMSDASAFTGTIVAGSCVINSSPNLVTMSGYNLQSAVNYTPAYAGACNFTVTASENGSSLPITFTLTVSASGSFLTVATGGRYLQKNGVPFLLAGDSAWALTGVTNLAPVAGDGGNNIQNYINTRSGQGFNTFFLTYVCDEILSAPGFSCNTLESDGAGNVPFNSLLPGCGSTIPDCYNMSTNYNTAFWKRLCGVGAADGNTCESGSIVGRAAAAGMYVAILIPQEYGGSGGPWNMLVNNGATRINQFGQFVATLFKNQWNVIWWLGDGDFQTWQSSGNSALVANFAAGLRAGGDNHIITSELNFFNSTTGDDATTNGIGSAINTNGTYSYYPLYQPSWHAYNATKGPVIVVESQYDALTPNSGSEPNLPSGNCNQGYGTLTACVAPSMIRKNYWWAFLAGARGFFYGEDTIEPNWYNWITAGRPGDFAGVWKTVIAAQPQWQNLVPDQTASVLTNPGSQFGSPPAFPDFSACPFDCVTGNTYSTAAYASTAAGALVMAYTPGDGPSAYSGSNTVNPLTIDMTKFGSGAITATWYDPTNGASSSAGSGLTNSGTHTFTPSGLNAQGDTDWVLVVTGSQPTGMHCAFGPDLPTAVPAQAQAAGFTTCAANYDFSQPVWANVSWLSGGWLECVTDNNPPPNVQFQVGGGGQVWTGTCPGTTGQVFDAAAGHNVLQMGWIGGDTCFNAPPPYDNCTNIMTTVTNSGQGNFHTIQSFPLMYMETRARMDRTFCQGCTGQNVITGSVWATELGDPGAAHQELDTIEMTSGNAYSAAGDGAGNYEWWFSNWTSNWVPAGYSITDYHVYSLLTTGDGSGNSYQCAWVDGIFQAFVGSGSGAGQGGCGGPGVMPQLPFDRVGINLDVYAGEAVQGATFTFNMLVDYIHIITCTNWRPGTGTDNGMCQGQTLNQPGPPGLSYYSNPL